MTYQTPCASPENNPDDWFIRRDGKQYDEDELLTEAEVSNITKAVLAKTGETAEDHRDRVDAAVRAAEGDRKRKALQRRRHAKEACHIDCLARTQCLDLALRGEENHGTWGGYHEEELKEIRREIARRKKAKKA